MGRPVSVFAAQDTAQDTARDVSASEEWAALQAHAAELEGTHLCDLFAADPNRAERFTVRVGDLTLDWSRHLATDRTMDLLVALARRAGVAERIQDVMTGAPVNVTEGRSVLHTALRAYLSKAVNPPGIADMSSGSGVGSGGGPTVHVEGLDVGCVVTAELSRMATFARSLRSGERLGATGRPIRTLVNLGIGGSHLGPMMAYEALAAFRHPRLRCRFVSNADGADLAVALRGLDPAETLFLVVSKSFTTAETMANARSARAWIAAALGPEAAAGHFAAVSADPDAVAALGIAHEDTFAMWDWVGGRYSLASTAGLSVMVAIGVEGFHRMLRGMRVVDEHLASRPLHANAPVLMGLLAVWCRNFCGLPTRAVLPYSQRLRMLSTYLQQLEMESNGKRVRLDGRPVGYDTSPIVWGGTGTDGQHSFHQMLHQGTTVVPTDFVVFAATDPDIASQPDARSSHDLLVANCLAQIAALAFGTKEIGTGRISTSVSNADGSSLTSVAGSDGLNLAPHRELPGNRPSTLITAPQLTPSVLGQLVALYEHQVLTQGAVWQINSFDQFGVEHGKHLAASILRSLHSVESSSLPVADVAQSVSVDATQHVSQDEHDDHDPATRAALLRIRLARQDIASTAAKDASGCVCSVGCGCGLTSE